MYNTRINNIIDSSGIEGWDTIGEVEYLEKTFTFNTFEEATAFTTAVSTYANSKDHHPEWNTSADGLSVQVRLTSHFAGNTLSLLDFELAQKMNQLYAKKAGAAAKLDNPNLVIGAAVLGLAGLVYYNQPGVKSYPTPSLDNLTQKPELKVGDVKDVDSYVQANLDGVALASQ